MSNPAIVDFSIANNVDLNEAFQWVDSGTGVPNNFTGSTFDMRIAVVAGGAAALQLNTGNGGIVSTDLANGTITLVAADGAIAVGTYVYDLVRITGSAREPLMSGAFVVTQGVTL